MFQFKIHKVKTNTSKIYFQYGFHFSGFLFKKEIYLTYFHVFLETRTLKTVFAGRENSKANITSPVISAGHFLHVSYIPRLFNSLNIDSCAQKTKNLKFSNFCNYTLLSMPMLYFHILFKKYTRWKGGSAPMHLKCQTTKTTLFPSFSWLSSSVISTLFQYYKHIT